MVWDTVSDVKLTTEELFNVNKVQSLNPTFLSKKMLTQWDSFDLYLSYVGNEVTRTFGRGGSLKNDHSKYHFSYTSIGSRSMQQKLERLKCSDSESKTGNDVSVQLVP